MTVGADGRVTETLGMPGTGISFRQTIAAGAGTQRTIARSLPYHPGRPASPQPVPFAVGCLGTLVLMVGCAAIAGNAHGEIAGVLPIGMMILLALPFVLHFWSKARARRLRDEAFEVYIQGLFDRFGEDNTRAMVTGDPWQGATQEMVSIMFGPPSDVSTRVHKHVTAEVWKYLPIAKNRYAFRVEFENGVCVGWQTS